MSTGEVSFSLGLELHRVIFYTQTCQRMAQYVEALCLPLENLGLLNLQDGGCPADPSRQTSDSS